MLNYGRYASKHLPYASRHIGYNQISSQPSKKYGIISILQVSKKAQTGEKPASHTASE